MYVERKIHQRGCWLPEFEITYSVLWSLGPDETKILSVYLQQTSLMEEYIEFIVHWASFPKNQQNEGNIKEKWLCKL